MSIINRGPVKKLAHPDSAFWDHSKVTGTDTDWSATHSFLFSDP